MKSKFNLTLKFQQGIGFPMFIISLGYFLFTFSLSGKKILGIHTLNEIYCIPFKVIYNFQTKKKGRGKWLPFLIISPYLRSVLWR